LFVPINSLPNGFKINEGEVIVNSWAGAVALAPESREPNEMREELPAVLEAEGYSVGQLVRPGISAEIEEPGVAQAGVPLIVYQIDARKAALRKLVSAAEGDTILSGAKLV
jgi:hypothetical protein